MAEIARNENCDLSLVWHMARASMLLNSMDPTEFIKIDDNLWDRYTYMDMVCSEALDTEEQVMTVAEEAAI